MSDNTPAQEAALQSEQRRMLKWLLQPMSLDAGEYPVSKQALEIGNKLALAVLLQPDKAIERDEYTKTWELYEQDATLRVSAMASPGGYGTVRSDSLSLVIKNHGEYVGTREAYEMTRYYKRDGVSVNSEHYSHGATYGVPPPHLALYNRFWDGESGKHLTQVANKLRTEFGLSEPAQGVPVDSSGRDPLSPSQLASWLMSPNNGRTNFNNSYGADLVRGRELTTAVLALGQPTEVSEFSRGQKAWALELPGKDGCLIVEAQASRGWGREPDMDRIALSHRGSRAEYAQTLFFMERCYTPDKSGAVYPTRLEMGQHDTRSVVGSWYKATRQGQVGRALKAKLGALQL